MLHVTFHVVTDTFTLSDSMFNCACKYAFAGAAVGGVGLIYLGYKLRKWYTNNQFQMDRLITELEFTRNERDYVIDRMEKILSILERE